MRLASSARTLRDTARASTDHRVLLLGLLSSWAMTRTTVSVEREGTRFCRSAEMIHSPWHPSFSLHTLGSPGATSPAHRTLVQAAFAPVGTHIGISRSPAQSRILQRRMAFYAEEWRATVHMPHPYAFGTFVYVPIRPGAQPASPNVSTWGGVTFSSHQ